LAIFTAIRRASSRVSYMHRAMKQVAGSPESNTSQAAILDTNTARSDENFFLVGLVALIASFDTLPMPCEEGTGDGNGLGGRRQSRRCPHLGGFAVF
jgi:hypothetical protein